jgi:hypothetical protein
VSSCVRAPVTRRPDPSCSKHGGDDPDRVVLARSDSPRAHTRSSRRPRPARARLGIVEGARRRRSFRWRHPRLAGAIGSPRGRCRSRRPLDLPVRPPWPVVANFGIRHRDHLWLDARSGGCGQRRPTRPPTGHGYFRAKPAIQRRSSGDGGLGTQRAHRLFLAAYQAFGPKALTAAEADQFVSEQARIGALLGAAPLPETEAGLAAWIIDHPDRASTTGQANAIGFLRSPPLSPPVKIAYRLLFEAAVTTIPAEVQEQLGLSHSARAHTIGRSSTRSLRWALGASPAWQLALVRCDAPIPSGLFRSPAPRPQTTGAPA